MRKFTTFATTIAVAATLIVSPATAATVSYHESTTESELECTATLSAAEKSTLATLARDYATSRSGFGDAVFPDLAKALGVSEQTIRDFSTKDKSRKDAKKKATAEIEKAAPAAGWTVDEVKELASFGRHRDADDSVEKYMKKYVEFNVDNDDWDGDYAKVMTYKKAATDLQTRLEYFEIDAPTKPFLAFMKSHDAAFIAPFEASYNLKSVVLRGMSACVTAYAAKKPSAEFTLDGPIVKPDLKALDKFTGEDKPQDSDKKKPGEKTPGEKTPGEKTPGDQDDHGSASLPVAAIVAAIVGVVALVAAATAVTAHPGMFPLPLPAPVTM